MGVYRARQLDLDRRVALRATGCSRGSRPRRRPAGTCSPARSASRHRPELDGTSRRFAADPWDGLVADRQRVLDFVTERGLRYTVVITGDKRQNSVRNVAESYSDPAGRPVATEFVGTSISSEGDARPPTTFGGEPNNPHIVFEDFHRGHVRVELDNAIWRSEFRVVEIFKDRSAPAWTMPTFAVENGAPGAQSV